MKRRYKRRDGFQGYSPAAAKAWDRIFGPKEPEPAKQEIRLSERPCERGKACFCTGACR